MFLELIRVVDCSALNWCCAVHDMIVREKSHDFLFKFFFPRMNGLSLKCSF